MIPSKQCIDFIKSFEGLKLNAYLDGGGVATIGWGTIQYPTGTKVKMGDTCTIDEAQDWLEYEVNSKAVSVNNYVSEAPVNQNQFDAFVSFAYNVGINALKDSTLLRKLKVNPNDITIYQYKVDADNGAVIVDSCEFVRWCRDNGKVINGLLRRRAAEADMYKG